MKKYNGIFFDWDGTAVLSRKAPVDDVIEPMKQLLGKGVKLAIISGTTMENIAGGNLPEYFTKEERKNLFLGLGRGAYNYSFDDQGDAVIFNDMLPEKEILYKIHEVSYRIHMELLKKYDLNTDVVFSRPNYCKIDLQVDNNRGESLFLQEGEKERLLDTLEKHGFHGGLLGLIKLAEKIGKELELSVSATTDAKYLEVGISSKSDNVNTILEYFSANFGITADQCSFWGDEYVGFGEGIFGSDSFMITESTRTGDFYDVSETTGDRPECVKKVGGGVKQFLRFLTEQAERF